MRAGQLKHQVTLQSPETTRDAVGEQTLSFSTVATVPASITPIGGREQFFAAQRHASTTHLIQLRYSSQVAALDATWRILFGSRVFSIDAPPRNVDEADVMFELQCTEGLRES